MFTQVLIEWKIQVWSCLLVDWCVFWFKIHLTQTNLFCSCVHLLCSMHCAYVTIRRVAEYTATSLCGFLFFLFCAAVYFWAVTIKWFLLRLFNFWETHFSRPQYPGKIQNYTRTNYSNSKRSENYNNRIFFYFSCLFVWKNGKNHFSN